MKNIFKKVNKSSLITAMFVFMMIAPQLAMASGGEALEAGVIIGGLVLTTITIATGGTALAVGTAIVYLASIASYADR